MFYRFLRVFRSYFNLHGMAAIFALLDLLRRRKTYFSFHQLVYDANTLELVICIMLA